MVFIGTLYSVIFINNLSGYLCYLRYKVLKNVENTSCVIFSKHSENLYKKSLVTCCQDAVTLSDVFSKSTKQALIQRAAELSRVKHAAIISTFRKKTFKSNIIFNKHINNIVVGELEQMSGANVVLLLELLNKQVFTLQVIILIKHSALTFWRVKKHLFTSFKNFGLLTMLFFKTGELDFYIEYVSVLFSKNSYKNFRYIYAMWVKILHMYWHYSVKNFNAVGLYVSLDGKLGKLLLTRGQTVRFRIGTTSKGCIDNNVLFRYTTIDSDSGVFGLAIYYYTKNTKLLESLNSVFVYRVFINNPIFDINSNIFNIK